MADEVQDPIGYVEVTVPVRIVVSVTDSVGIKAAEAAAWTIANALDALPVEPAVGDEVDYGIDVDVDGSRALLLDERGVTLEWLD